MKNNPPGGHICRPADICVAQRIRLCCAAYAGDPNPICQQPDHVLSAGGKAGVDRAIDLRLIHGSISLSCSFPVQQPAKVSPPSATTVCPHRISP